MNEQHISSKKSWAQPRLVSLAADLTAVAGNRGAVCQNGTMKELGMGNGLCPVS